MAKYKLNGFKFDRIILGTIPPRIGGVKIYDKNVSRNEIIMDLDLFYASDCDVNFALAGMKGGIKDFQIHGTVRVVMKPLIRQMPLVGGLQIFFLNNPRVDFNLVGVIDLLDMPGLSDILKRVVIEQIGNIMVLPNKLPITLNDTVSPIEVKMPEPEVSPFASIALIFLLSCNTPLKTLVRFYLSIVIGSTSNSCSRG